MGSVSSYEKCPRCGLENALLIDCYYKTEESYESCGVCGYRYHHVIDDVSINSAIDICKKTEQTLGLSQFMSTVREWVVERARRDDKYYISVFTFIFNRFSDHPDFLSHYQKNVQRKTIAFNKRPPSERFSCELFLLNTYLRKGFPEALHEANFAVIKEFAFTYFHENNGETTIIHDYFDEYSYRGYGFGPFAMEYIASQHNLSFYREETFADSDGIVILYTTDHFGTMLSYSNSVPLELDPSATQELHALIKGVDFVSDILAVANHTNEQARNSESKQNKYESVVYTKLEPFQSNEEPQWVQTSVYFDGRSTERERCIDILANTATM